ncbi:HDIG domain-containing metalloprotein [Methanolobus halotolerans]|uniref:HD domain-containing protein n=1 Tax=Methanolobus halotolerans TaxID=2052935 RepID=A0A4E0PVD4_9EURY|nr:HDIG domain-containing metalloprotein [Methanolobus halotolerans]TGC07916.1 HD domain-containing protein [Methanolobus halotolerans]
MISHSQALTILGDSGCSKKVIAHCIAVSSLATRIGKELLSRGEKPDLELIGIGGLLHDLGRAKTHGMMHAVEGARMAEEMNLDPQLVQIIKKHIGAGITPDEAMELGLPEDDYMPDTLEEKIVAHADNLTKGTRKITIEERLSMMGEKNINSNSIVRVRRLAAEIGIV